MSVCDTVVVVLCIIVHGCSGLYKITKPSLVFFYFLHKIEKDGKGLLAYVEKLRSDGKIEKSVS